MSHKNEPLRLETKFAAPEFKFSTDTGVIEGYASRFNEVDQGDDTIIPGAYSASLLRRGIRRVKMLWQHSPHEPIGVWEEIKEDGEGLYVRGKLIQVVQRAKEAAALIEAGALDGLSIGYRTVQAEPKLIDGRMVRQLKELDLWEVSVVTFPMQPSATIRSRKAEDWQNPRFVEQVLRDAGCSAPAAKRLVAEGIKAAPRDVGAVDGLDETALTGIFETMLKG